MSQTQNKSHTFSPSVLKRMINWTRSGLVPHPCGVRLVVNQIIFSLDQDETTLEELHISKQEIFELWQIAENTTDEDTCRQKLATLYHNQSSLAISA
jgi:hypothetical protein